MQGEVQNVECGYGYCGYYPDLYNPLPLHLFPSFLRLPRVRNNELILTVTQELP